MCDGVAEKSMRGVAPLGRRVWLHKATAVPDRCEWVRVPPVPVAGASPAPVSLVELT